MGIMYFLMIRPQQQREKERKAKIAGIQKGDEILTVGGVYGKVTQIDETSVLAQVDTNTKLRIDKNAIQTVINKEEKKA
jgi:preprotein translocase subunit YajC